MTKTEAPTKSGSLRHVLHGYRTIPFSMLPAPYGQNMPAELCEFEARAEEAQHAGRRPLRPARCAHRLTRPARQDASLERQ